VPNIYAGLAGLEIVERAGVAQIEEYVRGLSDRLVAGLDELGATVVTPREHARRGPLTCVRASDVGALVQALAAERIVVSARDANVRISPHLYNVEEDVDRILQVLGRNRGLLS
jgi:selenocysteine lyase/cysteine desulfurase